MTALANKIAAEHTFFPISGCFCREWRGSEKGHAAHVAEVTEAAVRDDIQAKAYDVLVIHTIECTGLGEVSCRGCREAGWMSWSAYRHHVGELIARVPS